MSGVLQVLASSGWGGTEKVFVELANRMALRRQVTVVVPGDAVYVQHLSDDVGAVRFLRPGSRRDPRVVLALRRTIREMRPDLVHSHAARATEMVYWATRLLPVRHVATKHNTRRRRIFEHVPRVTAVSEQARDSVVGRADVSVVHNGFEPRGVGQVVKPEIFTIVAVGRLDPYKGFDLLIRAAARLRFEYALEIAGEGPERTRLGELASDLGLGDRVSLLGHRDDVPELLARAHLQVVPSRSEGFSLALLEGLHYADLVVSTPVGLAPEVLPTELLCESAGLSERIGEAYERYDELREVFARVQSESRGRFGWSPAIDAYEEVYDQMMEES